MGVERELKELCPDPRFEILPAIYAERGECVAEEISFFFLQP